MHEISLVRTVFRTLEEEFPDQIDRLKKIHIKAGLLSNIQPVLVQNAFEAVVIDEPRYQHVQMEVEITPIIIHCSNCMVETQVENYRFVCKQCSQPSKNILQGEELLISRVEFEESEQNNQ